MGVGKVVVLPLQYDRYNHDTLDPLEQGIMSVSVVSFQMWTCDWIHVKTGYKISVKRLKCFIIMSNTNTGVFY